MSLEPHQLRALSRTLVDLAGPLGAADRARLLAVAAFVLGSSAEVVMLEPRSARATGFEVEAVAGTDDRCLRLAELERDGADGPAVTCARSGQGGPFTVALDASWQGWSRAAADQGWRAGHAVPICADGPAVGALVLLHPDAQGPHPTTTDWAHTLAAVAAAGLLQYRALVHERAVTAQLRLALSSRVVIEQAKGVLAERGGLDPAAAFDRMRRYARRHRRGLWEVAQDVVDGEVADAVLTCTIAPDTPAGTD